MQPLRSFSKIERSILMCVCFEKKNFSGFEVGPDLVFKKPKKWSYVFKPYFYHTVIFKSKTLSFLAAEYE